MKIRLSDSFTYKKLIRFTIPSIIMMIFTSVYGVVDGLFISNFIGRTEFTSVNFIMPFLMIFSAVGFMAGTGGSALVAKTLGEGNNEKARNIFSLIVYLMIGIGLLFTVLGIIFLKDVTLALGADEEMLPFCVEYGKIIMFALIPFMLQSVFQSFLVTAERPTLGLIITIAAGVTNIVLDALFVAVLEWGVSGAALATGISQFIGGITPLIFFILPNKTKLRLGQAPFDIKAIVKTFTNGSSEFMTNVSLSVVNMLYNNRLMEIAGQNGVAAYGVIMYVAFVFISVFLGYAIGSAPIVGYHYGAGNKAELRNVYGKSLRLIGIAAFLLTLSAELLAYPLSAIFVGYDAELFDMTQRGFMIYSVSYLLAGFNIYASSFFTALNNGFISALISFARTLVLQIICVLCLPFLMGINGIWLSIVFAEGLSLILTICCFSANRKKYGYA